MNPALLLMFVVVRVSLQLLRHCSLHDEAVRLLDSVKREGPGSRTLAVKALEAQEAVREAKRAWGISTREARLMASLGGSVTEMDYNPQALGVPGASLGGSVDSGEATGGGAGDSGGGGSEEQVQAQGAFRERAVSSAAAAQVAVGRVGRATHAAIECCSQALAEGHEHEQGQGRLGTDAELHLQLLCTRAQALIKVPPTAYHIQQLSLNLFFDSP